MFPTSANVTDIAHAHEIRKRRGIVPSPMAPVFGDSTAVDARLGNLADILLDACLRVRLTKPETCVYRVCLQARKVSGDQVRGAIAELSKAFPYAIIGRQSHPRKGDFLYAIVVATRSEIETAVRYRRAVLDFAEMKHPISKPWGWLAFDLVGHRNQVRPNLVACFRGGLLEHRTPLDAITVVGPELHAVWTESLPVFAKATTMNAPPPILKHCPICSTVYAEQRRDQTTCGQTRCRKALARRQETESRIEDGFSLQEIKTHRALMRARGKR